MWFNNRNFQEKRKDYHVLLNNKAIWELADKIKKSAPEYREYIELIIKMCYPQMVLQYIIL